MFRIVSLTSVALLLAVTGCAGPSEYDAEPDPTWDEQSASVGAPTGEPAPRAGALPVPNPRGAADRTDLLNAVKLDALPEPVRIAFNRDFPKAGITSIQRVDAATGLTLYEINFLLNRRPYDVIYRPEGTSITRTPLQDAR